MKELSEAKKKELETRAMLGPRLGHSKTVYRVTAEPMKGRTRYNQGGGMNHPTRDSE